MIKGNHTAVACVCILCSSSALSYPRGGPLSHIGWSFLLKKACIRSCSAAGGYLAMPVSAKRKEEGNDIPRLETQGFGIADAKKHQAWQDPYHISIDSLSQGNAGKGRQCDTNRVVDDVLLLYPHEWQWSMKVARHCICGMQI
jgi:hypothetical protein